MPDVRETDGHLHVGADHGVIRYMGTVGKPRPFGWANDYFFYQPELEQHLRAGLAHAGAVELVTGAVFTGLSQQNGQVSVAYTVDGQEQVVEGRWVIAADGSRSAVRKHLSVKLDDLDFEEPWLVVDVDVEGSVEFPNLTGVPAEADLQTLSVMMCDPKRPTTIVPGRRSHRRWEFMLLPHEEDEVMMQEEPVRRLLAPYLANVPHEIVHASTYRFHGLVAEQWQVGNVFLTGDAAHQTPPFFGQGMCHGFRDVANLAWKMAAIVNEGADPEILVTYQPERDAHVRSIIGAAVAAGRYICMLDEDAAAKRDAEMRERASFGTSETAADLIPCIKEGIIFAGSAACGERYIQPRLVNGRLLDDVVGGGWRLFALNAADAGMDADVSIIDLSIRDDLASVADWLSSHNVDAVLVRPDHYVFGTVKGSASVLLDARRDALGTGQSSKKVAA